jgi:phosphopantetheine adenylyltransferase
MIVFLYDWIMHIEQQLNIPFETAFLTSSPQVSLLSSLLAKVMSHTGLIIYWQESN